MVSNYVSVICTLILIFVPWKRGPKLWVKYAPYLFFFLVVAVYTIVPLGNMAFAIVLWADPTVPNSKSVYESWVVFYFIVNISRVASFITKIRSTFLTEARIFHEVQVLAENMEVQRL